MLLIVHCVVDTSIHNNIVIVFKHHIKHSGIKFYYEIFLYNWIVYVVVWIYIIDLYCTGNVSTLFMTKYLVIYEGPVDKYAYFL